MFSLFYFFQCDESALKRKNGCDQLFMTKYRVTKSRVSNWRCKPPILPSFVARPWVTSLMGNPLVLQSRKEKFCLQTVYGSVRLPADLTDATQCRGGQATWSRTDRKQTVIAPQAVTLYKKNISFLWCDNWNESRSRWSAWSLPGIAILLQVNGCTVS